MENASLEARRDANLENNTWVGLLNTDGKLQIGIIARPTGGFACAAQGRVVLSAGNHVV